VTGPVAARKRTFTQLSAPTGAEGAPSTKAGRKLLGAEGRATTQWSPLNITLSKTSKPANILLCEVAMHGIWFGLILGGLMVASGALAGADDVGCCIADCRISVPSGGVGRSITRNDMTQAECEGSFRDCERAWRSEACAAHPEVRELHMSPGVPALAPEEEARTPSDEE
jgi:hypothetical protein